MNKYVYEGPVMYFDNCIVHKWKAETLAVSKEKARSNLAYKWKIKNGYSKNAKISLPGKLILVDIYDSGTQLSIQI